MASSRTIILAGAGIGGLTAALALAQRGFRVVVLEQAQRLETAGAGIQLSPNASRILTSLGLAERLAPAIVVPEEVRIMAARGARPLARVPLGETAIARYGAPYWVIHRGDLQQALAAAVAEEPDITVRLGVRVEDCTTYTGGVTVAARHGPIMIEERGLALVGADGLWSALRTRQTGNAAPRFAGRVAWRATIAARDLPASLREPAVCLWLGRQAHLVHYPIRAGRDINLVLVTTDNRPRSGWSEPATRDALLAQLRSGWCPTARRLLEAPDHWQTWSLHDRPPLQHWGHGAVTLLGDAAHPMLPFLAQGGAMAIEDAAVLTSALAALPQDPDQAFRSYEQARRARTAMAQRAARKTGRLYGLRGPAAWARNAVIRFSSNDRLLARQDWLYDWKA